MVGIVLMVSACSSGSDNAAPRSVTELHATLADQVNYKFDLSVFVLDDGQITTAGSTNRLYSFDSITKTVTGLMLARLAESTDLELSTRVGSLLSAGANADITLVQLATHTAGLPRLAPNADQWPGFDPRNPYAGYTAEMAESALRDVRRTASSEYSNYGFQLLGLALERSSGRALGELAKELVFDPAGMQTASIPQRRGVLEDGLHDGRPAPAWDEQLGGAGGAIGSISDLAAYASMMVGPPAALRPAVDTAAQPRVGRTGLGWITTGDLTWHNGGSYAYKSLIVLDRKAGRAAGYLAATGDLGDEAEKLVFEFLESKSD